MKTWSLRSASGNGIVGQSTFRYLLGVLTLFIGATGYAATCERTLTADVVALDMPLMWNRLGAQNINGMMYALKRDVVKIPENIPLTELEDDEISDLAASGNIALRPDKRPRPLVLRMGAGDCMELKLTNLLHPQPNPFNVTNEDPFDPDRNGVQRSGIDFALHNDNQVGGRRVSLRFQGTQLVNDISDDGSNVGVNDDSTILPGESHTYTIFGEFDGAFVGRSYGDVTGGEGLGGTTASGLFAVLNIGPKDMAFYRSKTTNEELELATTGYSEMGHPVVDYEALYPSVEPWVSEGKAGLPILNMVKIHDDGTYEIVHNELDAIVAYGPGFELETVDDGGYGGLPGGYDSYLGHFPADTYPLESVGMRNPTVPNRLEPFREFTVAFHDEVQTKQAFPRWYEDAVFGHTLHGVKDAFMINYGSGGIGSEILANRFKVGPMHDCVNCAYEEFFLSFHTVGEVGQLTDIPANAGLENCAPTLEGCGAVGPKANFILYPDDPSNVHHTYQGDAVAFRNLHIGPGEQHVFHLHNHQWLFNADDPDSNYLDAQGLGPGSGYGYWINFGGSGNRNKSAGDAIFHCHFYPHFAQGMWEMWRIHDTFEPGTELQATLDGIDEGLDAHLSFAADMNEDGIADGIGIGNGTPADVDGDGFVRALPDGEVVVGAPTPAIIPLPGKTMPPMPAIDIRIVENTNTVEVCVVNAGPNEQRVLRDSNTGMCPIGTDEVNRPVGSLVEVARIDTVVNKGTHDRYGVYGPDGEFGADEYGNIDDVNPGYPFWIAGMEHTVGNRPPTPPLDMITHAQAQSLKTDTDNPYNDLWWGNTALDDANAIDGWDGGLPRFAIQGYSAGGETVAAVTRLDMSKEIHRARPVFFAEEGTDLEQIAMGFHARRCHDTTRIQRDADGYYGELAACMADPYDGDDAEDYDVGLGGNLTHGGFITNGNLPVAGAPFFEPCMDDRGVRMDGDDEGWFFDGYSNAPMWDSAALSTRGKSPHSAHGPRVYKAANVQFDAVLNKLGYHFPQQRIITLWHDVVPTIKQERPPEPFVMRLNTFDCAQYVHSNVVPKAYELDDYQVRTPTDIIGQHIHLPKWDLVSADGAGNGWNYEDGTLSPEAVIEMIHAINDWNVEALHGNIELRDTNDSIVRPNPVTTAFISPTMSRPVSDSTGNNALVEFPSSEADVKLSDSVDHPFFGLTEFADRWVGARSTIQRWFADPVVNVEGVDRGLGIIFTHDHYGPSTHQQIGLYATLLIEPAGSKWLHNETGTELYTRTESATPALNDGGPTSWQAAILTGQDDGYSGSVRHTDIESYREFYLEYSDFQHAYQPGVFVGITYDDNFNWSPVIATPEYADTTGDGIADNAISDATLTDFDKNTFRDALQPPIRLQASIRGGQVVTENGEVVVDDDGVPVNEGGFPVDIWEFPPECAPSNLPRPCPEAITANDPGLYVVNYRNESLAARIYDPDKEGPDGRNGTQADGRAGDLAFAMSSRVNRRIPELNSLMGLAPEGYFDGTCETSVGGVEVFCPPITSPDALADRDPFTPMLRVVDGDRAHVKMQAGGQEEEHGFTIHGLRWLQGGSGFGEARNSGWRNAQAGGISEQFSLRMPVFADWQQRGNIADYAYSANPSIDGWVSGTWGILRSYKPSRAGDLEELPNQIADNPRFANGSDFNGVCPIDAPVRTYDITAISVNDALPPAANVEVKDWFPGLHVGASPDPDGGTLVYNPRTTDVLQGTASEANGAVSSGPLHDPTGIIYVHTSDLMAKRSGSTTYGRGRNKTVVPDDPYCWEMNSQGKWSFEPSLATCQVMLDPAATLEPVVIRANAGDCIEVTVRNRVLQPAYIEANDEDGYQHDGDYLIFDAEGDLVYENAFALAEEEQEDGEEAIDADALGAEDLIWRADVDFDGKFDDGSIDIEDVDMLIDSDSETFASIVFDQTMDLANGNAIGGAVRRDPGGEVQEDGTVNGMTTFNNNLMQPSAHVGMRPQLVEYDVTRSDGFNVGSNNKQTAAPGDSISYKWYAGILSRETREEQRRRRTVTSTVVTATPIEFGGFNILSADPIEQGQKGLVAAGVIYPAGSTWTVDAGRNTAATVTTAGGHTFRDFTTVAVKGLSFVYGDSFPLENVLGEGSFGVAEDAQDMGHMAINFGNEAMWFRYGINPTNASGNAKCNGTFDPTDEDADPNCLGGLRTERAVLAYSNDLTGMDPETAVFDVDAGTEFRMHVLMPFAPGRGSTFDLHGHVFQRDPYICDETTYGLPGYCDPGNGLPGSGSVGSQNLGFNPVGFHLGGIESWFAAEHYEIFIPSAGGAFEVDGDYLFRDHMGLGNTGGLWGILRVNP